MSIVKMNADDAIATLVEAALPRFSGQDGRGLHIRLDLRISNYNCYRERGNDELKECSREHGPDYSSVQKSSDQDDDQDPFQWPAEECLQLHLLFLRPHNYTQVYAAVSDSWFIPKANEWELQSYHDSCWRSDGFRKMNEVVHNLMDKVARKDVDTYKDLEQTCWPNVHRVTIKTERGPENYGKGRMRVVEVTSGWPDGTEENPM